MLYRKRFGMHDMDWVPENPNVSFCIWPPYIDPKLRAELPDPGTFRNDHYHWVVMPEPMWLDEQMPQEVSVKEEVYRRERFAYCGFSEASGVLDWLVDCWEWVPLNAVLRGERKCLPAPEFQLRIPKLLPAGTPSAPESPKS